MADDVDITNERMEQLNELTLKHLRQAISAPTLIATGHCHFCHEKIQSGQFCDADCRDDHKKEQYALAQRPR